MASRDPSGLLLSGLVHDVPYHGWYETQPAKKRFVPGVPHCLGYGLTYPIALEGALELKEITSSAAHCEGQFRSKFKHGPLSAVHDGYPVVSFTAPGDERVMVNHVNEVATRGGRAINSAAWAEPSDYDSRLRGSHRARSQERFGISWPGHGLIAGRPVRTSHGGLQEGPPNRSQLYRPSSSTWLLLGEHWDGKRAWASWDTFYELLYADRYQAANEEVVQTDQEAKCVTG